MAAEAAAPQGHFHPKGKAPSKHTLEVLRKAKAALPFHDRRDFEENSRKAVMEDFVNESSSCL